MNNDFEKMIRSNMALEVGSPYVEVQTEKFRAVAKNFMLLPIHILVDLQYANAQQDGTDILVLFDAAELAFDEADFERLQDLTIGEFIAVMKAWINHLHQHG